MIAQGAARSAGEIRRRTDGFAARDIHELIWDPTVNDLDQVDLLGDAALG